MQINRHRLSNGLTIVHNHFPGTEMVAVNILYKVGSRNEDAAHTGFAHLFEHLMFGGSQNVPNFDTPLQLASGDNNAYTTPDYTNYYDTVPAANIETCFWLESDRMRSLAFTPESLQTQQGVVMEEFRKNYINVPYGDLMHLSCGLAYKHHPYRWPTIGLKLAHIEQATLQQVKDFFFRYYNPDNAILSVVGNITFEETVRLSEKWFGDIHRTTPPQAPIPPEPPQPRQRRRTVRRNVPQDLLFMSFHLPHRLTEAYHACDMITDVLANGPSSRLVQRLSMDRKVFSSVYAQISEHIDSGLLDIFGFLADGVSMEDAEAAIWQELDLLKRDDVDQRELEAVKNKYITNYEIQNCSYLKRAQSLAYFEMLGDPDYMHRDVATYSGITAKTFGRVCRQILTKKNSNVLYYMKSEG